MEKLLIKIS